MRSAENAPRSSTTFTVNTGKIASISSTCELLGRRTLYKLGAPPVSSPQPLTLSSLVNAPFHHLKLVRKVMAGGARRAAGKAAIGGSPPGRLALANKDFRKASIRKTILSPAAGFIAAAQLPRKSRAADHQLDKRPARNLDSFGNSIRRRHAPIRGDVALVAELSARLSPSSDASCHRIGGCSIDGPAAFNDDVLGRLRC
jgi:hypothetical protein